VPLVGQRPERLGIISKPNEPRAIAVAAQIAKWAEALGLKLLVDSCISGLPPETVCASQQYIADNSDLLIALGGDGTMIHTARLVAGHGTPVLGINLGSLGYLTEFAVEETISALEEVSRGDYQIDRRTMLDWQVVREGEKLSAGRVLNDVVVNKTALARIIEIDCSINSHHVTTYRGDGLIVATPTGSTAYNLSAGGPIIYPTTQAIAIAPICPHTLTNRPIVLPDTLEITLQLVTRGQEVMLTSDGHTGVPLIVGDRVEIKKSDKTFNLVRPKGRDYFQILRDKLKWSGR
jgi:NAD+ kinase